MSRQHALLSPSGGHRWMVCTPSARRTENMFTESEYAQEGTTAHELFEIMLKDKIGTVPPKIWAETMTDLQRSSHYNKLMFDHCWDFVEYVMEQKKQLEAQEKAVCVIMIEQHVNYSDYAPQGSGFVDVLLTCGKTIFVIDFKYGAGIFVSAIENVQLMLYGLGALLKGDNIHMIENIKLGVYQPRMNNISEWALSTFELLKWAEEKVQPAARLAWEGQGELVAGDHCKFCAIKTTCPALAGRMLSLTQEVFKDEFQNNIVQGLSDSEISRILGVSKQIKAWLGSIEAYALKEAIKGKKWPGYKMVSGRASRNYLDEEIVIETLVEKYDFKIAAITKTELLSPAAMEEYLGKKAFKKILEHLTYKSGGAPTLVPISDVRAEKKIKEDASDAFAEELQDAGGFADELEAEEEDGFEDFEDFLK